MASSLIPALPEALQQIRQRHQMTQAEFASMLGLTHGAISKYESGKASPSRTVLLLYLALAEGREKPAIFEAIGGVQNLKDLWRPGAIEAAMQGLREHRRAAEQQGASVLLADFAKEALGILDDRGPMDPVLVEVVREWRKHGHRADAREIFRKAQAYLEVELSRLGLLQPRSERPENRRQARPDSAPHRVMILCPETGQPVFTGVTVTAEEFRTGEIRNMEVWCPHCHISHYWEKADAYLEDVA
ncbi:MAG TPA: helix-turn-helix transcriptional regulator [Gemmataceae bacterium]|nr:helix-turn-helix transcriptional regulator [Gemmataceae bacterium]